MGEGPHKHTQCLMAGQAQTSRVLHPCQHLSLTSDTSTPELISSTEVHLDVFSVGWEMYRHRRQKAPPLPDYEWKEFS